VVLNLDNAESRRAVEFCYRTTTTVIDPIIDWSDDDVWEFLHHYGCEANPLYKCGYGRIGCIGCPMQGKRGMKKDFRLYPKYYHNYIRAFDKLVDTLIEKGRPPRWKNGEEVMFWWTSDESEVEGQIMFDGFNHLDV
jgi:phosphoadenosine phosphosulfate reductase